ncbi:hypothetical protein RQP54_02315 [Curvibacter sp. APW13]|uniref:hypothetical protein n=1 Tax=Curvibacter sp. APW13 TaxID=3077236 RepID=UPI0028DF1505|nr:hypothetical protein [Curvibacter sp. APW13]MDT8989692.1 hypothetical protein [Curvibacter sp. APW13]
MEELKPLVALSEPDDRQRFFVSRDIATGITRPLSVGDIYERAAAASLHLGVPEDVRSHFAMAQNLLAYSWYCYPFNVAAELHGYISVEFALKKRFPQKARANFHDLLNHAVSAGLLTSEGFTYGRTQVRQDYPRETESPTAIPPIRDYVADIAKAMRLLRNDLAHGSTSLHMNGGTVLLVCSELINQLFTPPATE